MPLLQSPNVGFSPLTLQVEVGDFGRTRARDFTAAICCICIKRYPRLGSKLHVQWPERFPSNQKSAPPLTEFHRTRVTCVRLLMYLDLVASLVRSTYAEKGLAHRWPTEIRARDSNRSPLWKCVSNCCFLRGCRASNLSFIRNLSPSV